MRKTTAVLIVGTVAVVGINLVGVFIAADRNPALIPAHIAGLGLAIPAVVLIIDSRSR